MTATQEEPRIGLIETGPRSATTCVPAARDVTFNEVDEAFRSDLESGRLPDMLRPDST